MATRINEYVRSLPGVARRTIERVLSDGAAAQGDVTLRTVDRADTSDLTSYSILTPAKLNVLLGSSVRKNEDAWNTVDEIDRFVRRLAERADSVSSGAARNIEKTKATLAGIFLSAARNETVDEMHVESFTGLENTDPLKTDAIVERGSLCLPIERMYSPAGSWSIKNVSPHNTVTSVDTATGAIQANANMTIVGRSSDKLALTAVFTLTAPSFATAVAINAAALDVKTVRIISATGQTSTIAIDRRVKTSEAMVVPFPRQSIVAVEVDFVQPHYTLSSSNMYTNRPKTLRRYAIDVLRNSVLGAATKITGIVDPGRLRDAMTNTRTYDGSVRLGEWAGREDKVRLVDRIHGYREYLKRNRITPGPIRCTFSMNIASVSVQDAVRSPRAMWTSTPIEITGDVKKLSLSVAQTEDEDVNVRWFVSIEGRPWLPIVPENARDISGEVLDPDFSGLASLQYPADPAGNIRVRGVPSDANITSVMDGDRIIAIRTDKRIGEVVLADYTTAYSGIVKVEELGLSSGDIKVTDAMTDGELGEHVSSVVGKLLLKHTPYGEALVYVDGILAVQVPEGSAFGSEEYSDTTKVYCKIVGKTVKFPEKLSSDGTPVPYKNVSVYYKYAQTSVRIRAVLESHKASEGKTPFVDTVTLGVKTMSA